MIKSFYYDFEDNTFSYFKDNLKKVNDAIKVPANTAICGVIYSELIHQFVFYSNIDLDIKTDFKLISEAIDKYYDLIALFKEKNIEKGLGSRAESFNERLELITTLKRALWFDQSSI